MGRLSGAAPRSNSGRASGCVLPLSIVRRLSSMAAVMRGWTLAVWAEARTGTTREIAIARYRRNRDLAETGRNIESFRMAPLGATQASRRFLSRPGYEKAMNRHELDTGRETFRAFCQTRQQASTTRW